MPMKGKDRIFTLPFFINAFVNLMLYVNYYVLMVVMAGYCMSAYGMDAGAAGFAASVFIVGALIARFLGGGIADRLGRKRCLVVCSGMMTVCTLCYLSGLPFSALFVLRIVHGFFYDIAQTSISSIATEAVPVSRKGEGIGYFILSATLGSAVGPFFGTVMVEYLDYRFLFVFCSAAIVLGFVVSLAVRDSRERRSRTLFSGSIPVTARTATGNSNRYARFALSAFLEYRVLPIACVVALAILAYGAVITYLDSFASEQGMVDAASVFFVVYSIVMFVSRPFVGRTFDRRGDFGVMTADFAAFALGMLCMGFAHDGAVLLVAACLLGFAVGTLNPCGLTLAVQKVPRERLTTANSTFSCLNDATIGFAPVVAGWAISLIGYKGMFLSLVPVVSVAYALYCTFRHKGML